MGAGATTLQGVLAAADESASSDTVALGVDLSVPTEVARAGLITYQDACALHAAESEASGGGPWTDSSWPAGDGALGDLVAAKFSGAGDEGSSGSVDWKWPEEIVEGPALFGAEEEPKAADVLEGRLGDW